MNQVCLVFKLYLHILMDTPDTIPHIEDQPKSIYAYSATTEELTGVPIISMKDERTGITLHTAIANSKLQFSSVGAYAGARYSRSKDSVTEIMAEIQKAYMEKGVSAQERLANIFRGYGHPSVGDMAQMMIYIENIPMIDAANIFYQSAVQSGQERSTRYQDFSHVHMPDITLFSKDLSLSAESELSNEYEGLKDFSLVMYHKYIELLTKTYSDYFKPHTKQEEKSLSSRVFDSARYWLLSGFPTSAAYITSAREWSRLIGLLKGSSSGINSSLGLQLENFLTPNEQITHEFGYMGDAPDLIRHTEINSQVNDNLHLLQEYLQNVPLVNEISVFPRNEFKMQSVDLIKGKYSRGELLAAKYILCIYPGMEIFSLLDGLNRLPATVKRDISAIIFRGQDRHNCLTEMAREGSISTVTNISIGEMRDMNRHRSMGKMSTVIGTINPEKLTDSNFTLPLYLTDIKEFEPIKDEFVADMKNYFSKLKDFYNLIPNWDNFEIFRYLLPLATIDTFFMSGGPREFLYTTDTRVRPGGHINYRDIAYKMALIASDEPFLSAMKKGIVKPNPASKEEFFDRS